MYSRFIYLILFVAETFLVLIWDDKDPLQVSLCGWEPFSLVDALSCVEGLCSKRYCYH
jgi:hypothetical protein